MRFGWLVATAAEYGRHLVATAARQSVVVFGPPGSGKTSSFANPTVLEWVGPAVRCSVTSEIMAVTMGVRSSHDRMAWVSDPTGSIDGVIRIGSEPDPLLPHPWPSTGSSTRET